jgi:hypothetical protein
MSKGDNREHKLRALKAEHDRMDKLVRASELELFRLLPKLDAVAVDARKREIEALRGGAQQVGSATRALLSSGSGRPSSGDV